MWKSPSNIAVRKYIMNIELSKDLEEDVRSSIQGKYGYTHKAVYMFDRVCIVLFSMTQDTNP